MKSNISESIRSISNNEARKILEALKRGGVPKEYAELLAVGRKEWLSSVKEDLEFIAEGGSKTRFLVAPYGGGKTHFLTLVSNQAIKQDFVVSYVELQSREAPFDKFEVIFSKIIRQIITYEDAGVNHILNKWASTFPCYEANEISSELSRISPSLDLRNALRSYLHLASINTPEALRRRQDIIAWMQGDSLPSYVLKELGIRNKILITNVSDILSSFLSLLTSMGYHGLVLLLDEAEAITSLTISKKREAANENLRKLIDNTDDNKGLYILFATTPKFMNDPSKGAPSYPALWDRIRTVMSLPQAMINNRSIIMNLGPLTEHDLYLLGQNIIYIHGISWKWSATKVFSQDLLKTYVNKYKSSSPDGPIRPFLRTLIELLDIVQQNQDIITLNKIISELDLSLLLN